MGDCSVTAGRPRNEARAIAIMVGDRFYEGSACWCGNTTRYSPGARCVDCAIAQAHKQTKAKRKPAPPKMATPAQQRIIGKHPILVASYAAAAAGIEFPTPAEIAAVPLDPISQQIADVVAREEAETAEEAARAEKITAINLIETGGLTLYGIKVSELEVAEDIQTSTVPDRVMQLHNI